MTFLGARFVPSIANPCIAACTEELRGLELGAAIVPVPRVGPLPEQRVGFVEENIGADAHEGVAGPQFEFTKRNPC
jgi:hypothetical protein